MMNADLETRIETALSELSPETQRAGKEYVKDLSALGLNNLEDLLRVVQDETFETNARRTICWVLGILGDKQAVEPLLTAFSDPDIGLSWEAGKALGALRSGQAVQPLITWLLDAETIDKRMAAAYALGMIGDRRATESLIRVLVHNSAEPKLRGEAAEALGLLGDTHAVAQLIGCLRDKSVEVRFWSAFALGQIGDRRALPELKRLATTDEELLPGWWKISKEAADAVEQIETSNAR